MQSKQTEYEITQIKTWMIKINSANSHFNNFRLILYLLSSLGVNI